MYKLKICLSAAAALLLMLGLGGPAALAFHDGGVAHCDGCHTMHNSRDGQTVTDNPGSNLLAGSDASSVCLNCHQGSGSFRILSENGSNFTPGGDFFWTTVDVSWDQRGTIITRNGYGNGHSVVAADFPDIQLEGNLTSAPGGSFPAAILGCQSCHDPHGSKTSSPRTGPITGSGSFGDVAGAGEELGNYRLLADVGYNPTGSGVTFTEGPPTAVALPNSASQETDSHHADYGSGMSEWCANCHGGLLVSNSSAGKHPSGDDVNLTSEIVANYNRYVASGDTTGIKDTAYFALVPIERGTSDVTALDTESTVGATDGQDNVSCLSCHRAHASAFEYGTRWDTSEEFLVDSHPQVGDTVTRSDAATLQTNSYYGRDIAATFGEFQRSLCNKCHLQD
jgi:hypothetical protein